MDEYKHIREQFRMEEETIELADWMIDHNCPIREVAREFMMSKSTVHRRLQKTLRYYDYDKWQQCQKVMRNNRLKALEKARVELSRKRAQK